MFQIEHQVKRRVRDRLNCFAHTNQQKFQLCTVNVHAASEAVALGITDSTASYT